MTRWRFFLVLWLLVLTGLWIWVYLRPPARYRVYPVQTPASAYIEYDGKLWYCQGGRTHEVRF